ncbi:FAD-dependent pyridine nucleotide-disulfide oxidoreductase [Exidia glandulosa HHB12029]|uniref:FAD-dependent pyridine nucleotide-disulfide oxidoreductase n=1 Tax=Exidia glandulosa HHB12029 TaxID=1314781 RepID=A0A165EJN0_EXIGL|nr:FAD-dependent pyridine nucleotide-disulfide oxidoreductase [Exidia glandulosa HHB12029]
MTATILKFDAVVVGSGQAGNPLAVELAKAGMRVAVVEREHVGGTCVNEGCTPTKTMIASGRVAYLARRAADYGVHLSGDITIDMRKVRQRKRDIVSSFRGGSESSLAAAGVTVFMGEASFTAGGPPTLRVKLLAGDERLLQSNFWFINTGARPAVPTLDGLDSLPQVLTSTSIMELDVVPEHLIVLGGGYIGVEFAQLMRRLGARVTLVQRGKQLLPNEDADVADVVAEILREDGIDVMLDTSALSVTSPAPLAIDLRVSGDRTISGSHLLVATGRTPNADVLNVRAAGVECSPQGFVKVNAYCETNIHGIWALGDVTGPPAFTHTSYDDYRIVAHNVLKPDLLLGKSREGRLVPYTVFMDPQLGHVGMHEHEARKSGKPILVASMKMSRVARALEVDETRGLMKAVVDAETDKILGFTCLGIEGGEVMNVVQTAIMGGLPYTALQNAIWAHPTLGEALNNLWADLH